MPAGGSEHLATAVAQLRAKNPNHIFVAAGDLIGASPLLSALFHDEPTVEALGLMGLEASAVGNHEFDHGAAELLRMQNGGCHPGDGCKGPQPFKGASFKYLAASTFDTRSGQTIFPSYHVKRFEGIPVAFIGLTLKDTPNIVVPSGVAGLRFDDEAATVNKLVPELQRQGIEAIVVLIHEGGFPTGDYNECPGISGPIVDIVKKLDKAVDLVVSGHTHRAYNCRIDGRLVTSGDKYGTIVSEIDLVLDPKTGKVTQARADNLIVRTDRFNKDPAQTQLITTYEQLAAPLAKRVVGKIAAPLTRDESPAGETPVGQVVADAQLAATRAAADGGAQIALMNPGGLRANLTAAADGAVRYEDLFAVQPFYNNLITLSLTGAQVVQVLEQQWLNQARPRILQVSRGFAYTWDNAKPAGQRVVPGSVTLDGKALEASGDLPRDGEQLPGRRRRRLQCIQAGPRAAHRRDGRRCLRAVHRPARTGRDRRARSHQAAQLTVLAPAEIIRTKRDGGALDAAQIDAFVQGLAGGGGSRWSEGQVAALAMAVLLNGMTRDECVALTRAMTHSGTVLDWSRAGLGGPIVDKHSTGGVGDKVSLMLAPIVAACGGVVPMVSGRGLGHTGGTLDKMQSLAGYDVAPSRALLTRVLRDAGCAIVGASARVAPADRRLYAIRDVTATVESVPLITASILSKKLAAGLRCAGDGRQGRQRRVLPDDGPGARARRQPGRSGCGRRACRRAR